MKLNVNGYSLDVTLADTVAAQQLVERLSRGSIALHTEDYGGWEKVGSLGFSLPRSDEPVDMKPGDIVLYQGNQLVIMYGHNSWSETRIGHVDGYPGEELQRIFGDGDAEFLLTVS